MSPARVLTVGPRRLCWTLSHQHRVSAADARQCVEILRVWLEGRRNAALRLELAAGPGRIVRDGHMHRGGVALTDPTGTLNLNEPGVVRALVDRALTRGWSPEHDPTRAVDGWPLVEAMLRAR